VEFSCFDRCTRGADVAGATKWAGGRRVANLEEAWAAAHSRRSAMVAVDSRFFVVDLVPFGEILLKSSVNGGHPYFAFLACKIGQLV
jgi:hypothetical protein